MSARMVIGDVFDCLAATPDGSVDLILTSPPFLALRSYLPADHPDKAKEIGSEPDPGAFIDTLLALSAEWRRVLAPHGSIAIELGDTYSGSGGDNHLYEGSNPAAGFNGSAGQGAMPGRKRDLSRGTWPEAKSLALVPESYRVALAYGRNPITGTESPAGRWKVRNVVRWCRPNPPVGALGDKFRPGTSDMVIACTSGKRYFDLDAVRTPSDYERKPAARATAPGQKPKGCLDTVNAAGAPPLDWWEVSTEGYSGSHYATWPRKLLTRPILAMCPQKVCTVCGEPSRRIVEAATVGAAGSVDPHLPDRLAAGGHMGNRHAVTIGWTDCGHGSYRCSCCHVLVPLDHALRRSREGQGSEAQVRHEAVLAEPIEGQAGPADDSGDLRAVRSGVPGPTRGEVLHPKLFGEVGARRGSGEHDPATNTESGSPEDGERVREDVGARGNARTPEERPNDGAPTGDAGAPGSAAGSVGDRAPSQRGEGRQPDSQPRGRDAGASCRDGGLPALHDGVPSQLAAYECPGCGGSDVEYVADHWRNGIVLDPFAGSGTTLAVATGLGRDAVGFDLDERNAALAMERVGMFLTVETLERAS